MTYKFIFITILSTFFLNNLLFASSLDFGDKSDYEVLEFVRDVSLNKTFTGLMVAHNTGGKKFLARVSQGKLDGVIQKKREFLDKGTEYIHIGTESREYFLDEKLIKIRNNAAPVFPNFLLFHSEEILRYYNLKRYGFSDTKIANKTSFVFELESKDSMRWGVRFWIDSMSGLLLKLQYMDNESNVLKKEFFAEISIGPSTKSKLYLSAPDSKKWRKIYISSFTDQNAGLVYNNRYDNGFSLVKCLNAKVIESNQVHNENFVRHQCFFSDGVALISAITHDQKPLNLYQYSKGCMSQKVGLKGNKPMYIGGCVPRETIQYFFNKLNVE